MRKTRDEVIEQQLNKRQKLFCLFYLHDFDLRKAAINSGIGNSENAAIEGAKLLHDKKIKETLKFLRPSISSQVTSSDLIDFYSKVAFADYSDCIKCYKNDKDEWVSDIDVEKINGQMIEEITAGRGGLKIKFLDKFKALEKLEKYLGAKEEQNEKNANSINIISQVKRPEKVEEI